jgi:hypothetical protein
MSNRQPRPPRSTSVTLWAGQYREHLHSAESSNIREVISQINKKQKRGNG